jgi:micrococcal nuclease
LHNGDVPRPPTPATAAAAHLAVILITVLVLGACGRGVGGSGASTAGANANPSTPAATAPGTATVVSVTDGDTMNVQFPGRRDPDAVRLIGVDTPETHGPGGLRECFGKEASERTSSLLPPGTEVRLVRDAEARDRYARLLAYVYRKRDGLFVNLALARDGFAVPLTIAPNNAHTAELVEAAADARTARRGLWAACGGADTPL